MIISLGKITPKIDSTVYVGPGAMIIGNVAIGCESSIWFNTVLRGDNASIVVGSRTNIQDGSVLHVDSDAPLNIGDDVTVGHNAIIHGATIGNGALIGMGAIVMNHSEIGEEALIAAGSLVPQGKKVPPRTLFMGSPGKVIRELTDTDLEKIRLACESYVQKSRRYMEAENQ